MKDELLGTIDDLIAEMAGKSIEEILSEFPENGRWLITRDELLAAGALDVPPSWRKSLRSDPNLFSELPEDDDKLDEKHQITPRDPDGKESAPELR